MQHTIHSLTVFSDYRASAWMTCGKDRVERRHLFQASEEMVQEGPYHFWCCVCDEEVVIPKAVTR